MKLNGLIKDRGGYAVVGNSPKEIGKGKGLKIDTSPLILRFNDFSLDSKFHEDYGSKVNVWVRATNDKILYTFDKKLEMMKSLDLVMIRAKSERNKESRIFYKKNNIPFDFFPIKYEQELTHLLGHCPSTGLLTLFYIYRTQGFLIEENLFGFSFCRENRRRVRNGRQIHYYNKNDLVNPRTNRVESIKNTFFLASHDWREEEIFYNKMIKGEI